MFTVAGWWPGDAQKGFERLEAGTRCVKPELYLSVEKARENKKETVPLAMKRV